MLSLFVKNKISSIQAEQLLMNEDVKFLTKDEQYKYYELVKLTNDIFEHDNKMRKFKSNLPISILRGFTGNFSFIPDTADVLLERSKLNPNMDKWLDSFKNFFISLVKNYSISKNWLDTYVKEWKTIKNDK